MFKNCHKKKLGIIGLYYEKSLRKLRHCTLTIFSVDKFEKLYRGFFQTAKCGLEKPKI